jgi:molybdenum cofactor synthesis domain-containing protein
VIISSTRAAAGVYPDRTGPVIASWLRDKGFDVDGPVVVPDAELAGALAAAVGTVAVVITSGGTGLSPTDRAPEATRELLDREIPGLAEAIRLRGSGSVPTAALSRGLAGVAAGTLVVNLPGSTGGVRDGLAVLDDVLEHAIDQIAGGDHPRPGDQSHGENHDAATGSG